MTTDEKKKQDDKAAKADFALHVALLERTGLKVADARAQAWLQGPKGLQKLLPLNTMGGNDAGS